jgi:tetratricopeptide (TPR) repeat protein
VYVEQNRLDEAEALYRKCLELDPKDGRAAAELRYVQAQRAKAGNP